MLRVFENRVLRGIFGPKRDEVTVVTHRGGFGGSTPPPPEIPKF
jgi:hypothetical protein